MCPCARTDKEAGHRPHPAVLERLDHLTSRGRGDLDHVVGDGPAAVAGFSLALGDAPRRVESTTQLEQRRRVGAPPFTAGPAELGVDAHEPPHLVDVGDRGPVGATGRTNPVEGAFAPRPSIVHASQSMRARSASPSPPDRRDGAEDRADHDDRPGPPRGPRRRDPDWRGEPPAGSFAVARWRRETTRGATWPESGSWSAGGWRSARKDERSRVFPRRPARALLRGSRIPTNATGAGSTDTQPTAPPRYTSGHACASAPVIVVVPSGEREPAVNPTAIRVGYPERAGHQGEGIGEGLTVARPGVGQEDPHGRLARRGRRLWRRRVAKAARAEPVLQALHDLTRFRRSVGDVPSQGADVLRHGRHDRRLGHLPLERLTRWLTLGDPRRWGGHRQDRGRRVALSGDHRTGLHDRPADRAKPSGHRDGIDRDRDQPSGVGGDRHPGDQAVPGAGCVRR